MVNFVYDDSVKERIKEMDAVEVMKTFCPGGNALPGIDIDEDYNREVTILRFPDFVVEMHDNIVIVK